MKIQIPHHPTHTISMLTVETPKGTFYASFDDRHLEYDFRLPEGVEEKYVGAYVEFGLQDGRVDPLLKRVVVCEAEPWPESEPQPVVVESDEPIVEPEEMVYKPVVALAYPVRRKFQKP